MRRTKDRSPWQLLEAAEILHSHAEAPFAARLAEATKHVFRHGFFAFDVFRSDGTHYAEHDVPFDSRTATVAREHGPEMMKRDHPFGPSILEQRASLGRLSDLATTAFYETALYRELYRTVAVDFQLVAPVRMPIGLGTFTINRDAKDFSDIELRLAAHFVRHVERAFATDLLLGDRAGVVDESAAALRARLGHRGVTRRESDVLYWLKEGKRNAEIAIILGISMRTVEVHLANSYRKLGVDGRAAAVVELLSCRP